MTGEAGTRGFHPFGGGGFGGPRGGECRKFDDEGRRGAVKSSDLDIASCIDGVDD